MDVKEVLNKLVEEQGINPVLAQLAAWVEEQVAAETGPKHYYGKVAANGLREVMGK